MQYPIIDNLIYAYQRNGWTGLDIPDTIIYEPIQLGNGNPSPINVRPILPATILNIGGVDVPVYGGILDVNTGVLTVDHAEVNLGLLTWSYTASLKMFIATVPRQKTSVDKTGLISVYTRIDAWVTSPEWINGDKIFTLQGRDSSIRIKDTSYIDANTFTSAMSGIQFIYELQNPTVYQLTTEELINAIRIKDNIAHRLKLPLVRNFPHPVIDALISAADGQQTEEENEILRHYLTPLGIGGI